MNPSNALLSALLLSTGCALNSEPALPYAQASDQVAEDLQTLRSLELFEVGALVIDAADAPGACYGECPDEARRQEVFSHQAERLHALTALTADLAGYAPGPSVQQDLDALNALEIVSLGAFMQEEATPSPYCYNLVCPEEQARVDAENDKKKAKVAALRAAASGL